MMTAAFTIVRRRPGVVSLSASSFLACGGISIALATSTVWQDLKKLELSDFAAGVERLKAAGIEYLFVDTPPSVRPELRTLLAHASLAMVPVRPSPDDLDAVGDTLALIEEAGCPFVFVLTQAKPRTRLQMQAVMALAKHGKLAPTVVHDRQDFPTAAISGKAVTEIEPETAAAREVKEVLDYVLTQLRKEASKAER